MEKPAARKGCLRYEGTNRMPSMTRLIRQKTEEREEIVETVRLARPESMSGGGKEGQTGRPQMTGFYRRLHRTGTAVLFLQNAGSDSCKPVCPKTGKKPAFPLLTGHCLSAFPKQKEKRLYGSSGVRTGALQKALHLYRTSCRQSGHGPVFSGMPAGKRAGLVLFRPEQPFLCGQIRPLSKKRLTAGQDRPD